MLTKSDLLQELPKQTPEALASMSREDIQKELESIEEMKNKLATASESISLFQDMLEEIEAFQAPESKITAQLEELSQTLKANFVNFNMNLSGLKQLQSSISCLMNELAQDTHDDDSITDAEATKRVNRIIYNLLNSQSESL